MIVTSRILEKQFGIDPEIADYFANKRAVPQNNRFWKNKRIYLSVGFGYLTIPFAFDLMHKCGIAKSVLLEDQHVALMEQGFDLLRGYEKNELSFVEFTTGCMELVKDKVKQKHLAADLFAVLSGREPAYFSFEKKHKALARSDHFLFTLVDLDLSDEWIAGFLKYWYAMARPILLLDDFKDLEEDRRDHEENTIIELGNNAAAIKAAYEFGLDDLAILETINPLLAAYMRAYLKDALNYKAVREELN